MDDIDVDGLKGSLSRDKNPTDRDCPSGAGVRAGAAGKAGKDREGSTPPLAIRRHGGRRHRA